MERSSTRLPSASSLTWVILLAFIVGVTVAAPGFIAGGWAGVIAWAVFWAYVVNMTAELAGVLIAHFAFKHELHFLMLSFG